MAWYIVSVKDEAGRDEGCAIFDSVCGAVVRPLENHPQSVFSEPVAHAIANYLADKYGDPRKAEHRLTDEEFNILVAGATQGKE